MNNLKHLACIMDGNRRWAYARGIPAVMGHREGVHSIDRVAKFCLKKQIPHVSFYVFSIENLQRSLEEKTFLYQLIVHESTRIIRQAQEQDIRVRFLGDKDLFNSAVKEVCQQIEHDTRAGTKLTADMLFCYGGQQEIVHAMQMLARDVEAKKIGAADITQRYIEQYLWTHDSPPPDLIIRTGGFQRLSGFHLYHAAYAELRFLECLWPDLSEQDLVNTVNDFYRCQRRFGT